MAIDFARTSFGRPRFYRASHTPIRSLEAELVEIDERIPSVAGFGVQAYQNGDRVYGARLVLSALARPFSLLRLGRD